MCTDRRDFLRLSAGIAGATLFGGSLAYAHSESSNAAGIAARADTTFASYDRQRRSHHDGGTQRAHREGAEVDARPSHRRDLHRARQQHVLLHRHALGHERANVCHGDSGARRDCVGVSEV